MVVTELSPPNQVLLNLQYWQILQSAKHSSLDRTPVAQFEMSFVTLSERSYINFNETDQGKQYKIAVQRYDQIAIISNLKRILSRELNRFCFSKK